MKLPGSPISAPSRRPSFLILAFAIAVLLFSFNFLFYDLGDTIAQYSRPHRAGKDSWLILTMSRATHFQRRHIIRNTWQKLYKGKGLFETKFVISDPGEHWNSLLLAENATHGDLIMLPYTETKQFTATVKTIESFRHVVENTARPYTWVSKMDEESWLDARTFHNVWLAPLSQNGTTSNTYIGREQQFGYPFRYASGQFYTLSWDLVTLLLDLFDANSIADEAEDVLVGRLFYEASVPYNLTTLPPRAVFDYDSEGETGDGTAWANPLLFVDNKSATHAIAAGSVVPGKLTSDDLYLRVAACYDEDGVASTGAADVDWSRYMGQVSGWDMSVEEYVARQQGVAWQA